MLCSTILNGQHLPTEQSDVVVPWWSFTKSVLATAALSLVRDGLIQLDDPVKEGPFTLRQLLKHQAGLADYSELPEYHAAVAEGHIPWPAAEMMQRLDATRLRYAPGTAWRYSNVGYLLVARLIERVTGLSLEDALARRVLLPLGVTQVRFAKTRKDLAEVYPANLSSYHPGWVYHGLLVGPLSESSMLLDRLLTGQLLPSTLLQEMQDAIVLGGPIPGRPWAAPGYGLGLMIGGTNGGLTLAGHTGTGPGGVIAVFHCSNGHNVATCSVFDEHGDEGQVEAKVLEQLLIAVGAPRQLGDAR
ncbi:MULTISPECIES: serine hydrolase domain-containing protein [Pseudomonas syringae group]|nr:MULTISPECIES: serine hydrolase domain-containing protein [Pseudomonas syringae group]EGH09009.1 beta-lactamase [Pseudomonas amygdali pv. morsprunorum str. M302280]KWS59049.1 serine hydrolase [Pseudomonas amygdali pv. morsprunorum]PHN38400.1 serine hydrolase [Pseudomonas avellanae]POC85388.1 serine hydrolase [Pseudomonas avellanae]POD03641.1 serine hydrolase [Pseudomonas avellanae]